VARDLGLLPELHNLSSAQRRIGLTVCLVIFYKQLDSGDRVLIPVHPIEASLTHKNFRNFYLFVTFPQRRASKFQGMDLNGR